MTLPRDISPLIEDYLDGALSEQRFHELEAWISQSEENALALAAWLHGHVELSQAARVERLYEVTPSQLTTDGVAGASPTLANVASPSTAPRPPRASLRQFLSIAAGIAAVVGATLLGVRLAHSPSEQPNNIAKKAIERGSGQLSVATLSRAADCVWTDGAALCSLGQDLDKGQLLDLQSGLVQVTFESGAEIVLRGPSRFRIDGPMRGLLYSGSVTATVPRQASGFTIRSTYAEVIDLGTEFGFSVAKSGDAQVHVFKGEVISRRLDGRGLASGESLRLTENQAALFPGTLEKATRMAADEARFARTIPPLWNEAEVKPLPVMHDLVFWLNADLGVQADDQQRVIAWQDLAIDENRIAEDAFQPAEPARPRLVAGAMNGQPAVRFDGRSTYLSTTPMTTTDDQTIVAVFQYAAAEANNDSDDGGAGHILNYNGPPSRYLATTYEPGVLQLGHQIGYSPPLDPTTVSAKAYSGRESDVDVSTGWLTSEPLGYGKPAVAVYVYDNTRNRSSLFINGVRCGDSSARTPVAINSRKVIGKHGIFDQWYFSGDLGQLLIFNAALSQEEVGDLSRSLMSDYKILTAVGDAR